MLLNFIKVDFRTKVLVEKYTELISAGVKPSEILVLVQNSTLKKQFVDKILENIKIDAIEKLNVHSFFSIVYFDNKKHFYINLMILERFIKLYYKMKENYTLNSNNL